jgi:hypothetical protein
MPCLSQSKSGCIVSEPIFALGTLVPGVLILGGWYVFRNSRLWLRALTTALTFFGPFVGFVLVMESIENPSPGAGIAAMPMVLVWFSAMFVTLVAEGARVWGRRRSASSRTSETAHQ